MDFPSLSYPESLAFLVACVRARIAAMLIGPPGIGKTALVNALDRVVGLPVHTLIGSTVDPTDVGGIPWVRQGKASATLERAPIGEIQACAASPGLLFLDELSCAPPSVQASLLRLVLDYAAGSVRLHEGSRILAACNPPEQAPGGFELSAPLVGRLTIATLAPTLADVRAYFRGDGSRTLSYSPAPYDAARTDTLYRRLSADWAAWNESCDMAINGALRQSGIVLPSCALYPPSGLESATAEEVYDALTADARSGGGDGDGESGDAPATGGCGVLPAPDGDGDGDGHGCGIPAPGTGKGDSAGAVDAPGPGDEWAGVAAQCRASARSRGAGSGDALARVVDLPPARVPWASVLRHALAHATSAHGRQDRSFRRVSRRQQPGIVLPGWIACRARVGVVIDTSGSMSDAELARVVSEVGKLAREAAAGARIYLVTHDYEVQYAAHVRGDDVPAVRRSLVGRGGTDFRAAYRRLADAGRLDVAIHLTDGECSPWPDMPSSVRHSVVALVRDRRHVTGIPARARVVEVTP